MLVFSGSRGLPQDCAKIGTMASDRTAWSQFIICNIGIAYISGDGGVEIDEKRTAHYFEVAAWEGT